MTPLRQAIHAAVVAAGLALTLPALAAGAEGSELIGPPTAEQAAAEAEAAKPVVPVAPVVQPAAKPAQPAWLSNRPAPKAATGKNATPATGRMVGLVIVLATLGAAAWYLKRRNRGATKLLPAPKRLSVVSSTRIGPKAHAVVISVNGRQMLLGVTDSSVKRLAFIDELEEDREEREREAERRPAQASARLAAQAVRAAAPQEPAQSRSFAELLKTAFKKREPAVEVDAASILAAETHDVVGGKPVTSNVHMLDVEGQAQGLIRRLSSVGSTGPRV